MTTDVATVDKNWQLLAITVAAAVVCFGITELNSDWLEMLRGTRAFRKITIMLMWCRANPNTVHSSALIVGVGSLSLFVYRVAVAWHHHRQSQTDADEVNEAS